jgi:hypothetical protein
LSRASFKLAVRCDRRGENGFSHLNTSRALTAITPRFAKAEPRALFPFLCRLFQRHVQHQQMLLLMDICAMVNFIAAPPVFRCFDRMISIA